VPLAAVDRAVKKELGGGALMDVGCYTVQYANLVFRDKPDSVYAIGDLSEEGEFFMDVGCYTVQYANLVFRDKPDSVYAVGDLSEEGEFFFLWTWAATLCNTLTWSSRTNQTASMPPVI
jgi:predicted dehydrogenase